jgi:branched-chain amino acid transport system ATP-binding protein
VSAILSVTGLQIHYGVIEAVKGIDLALTEGKITTLLGANGAGKSTTLLALSGLLRATAGSIIFDGMELRALAPHRIVDRGLVQVPEGREILTTLTVRENLLLGAYRRQQRDEIATDLEQALRLFLGRKTDGTAGTFQAAADIRPSRALSWRSRVAAVDEPLMGWRRFWFRRYSRPCARSTIAD